MADEQMYNAPPGTPSDVGYQMNDFFYYKKALHEARELQYFMPLASAKAMPKHMGKELKMYHYIPLLDDENVNDQGLDAAGASYAGGNMYGSSRDIGNISTKFPTLSEEGGRVNRVGFKRKELSGTLVKMGFFHEYTKESLDFDSDAELKMHTNREMLNGAHEITEDRLQIDLLNSPGVIRYAGTATSIATVDDTAPTYRDLLQLHLTLSKNHTPMNTKMFTGTRMVDTKTIAGGRIMYIGAELQPMIEEMVDFHNNPAFIPVHMYAGGGSMVSNSPTGKMAINGEIGTVGHFRIVVVPKMLHWAGAGADATGTATHYETGDAYDVFPMLVVGDESFSTIGFQTSGKTVKFKIKHRAPESEGSYTADDPFGERGFMSIKWYYGYITLRPERLAVFYASGKM